MNFKKNILRFFALLFIAQPLIAVTADDLVSGKNRIADIMSNTRHNIKAITLSQSAQTKNLTTDINTEALADYFGCKTLIGKLFLKQSLENPIASEALETVVAQRTAIIKALLENPKLKEAVDALLSLAHEEEQNIIHLFSDFFKGETCPELRRLKMLEEQKHLMRPIIEWMTKNPLGSTYTNVMSALSATGCSFYAYKMGEATYQLAQHGLEYSKPALMTTYFAALGCFSAYQLGKDYLAASKKRTKIHALNRLIYIAEQLEELYNDHELTSQFTLSKITDTDGVALLASLKASRYQYKDTIFFATPLVHSFMYDLFQKDKQLAQVFACVAEMDAYNAIATKMIDEQNNAFCFATFIENDAPQIHGAQVWNALVKNAVASNITENKHIILTGPNAGGKTTSIRALLQNIVLAQTFGVAAAQEFNFTPFAVIHSYLHISDDLINGLSLFASEVKRAQEILEQITALEPGKKFFFALDELFTGTAAEAGETCAYNFIQKVTTFDHVQFIYATHFDALKKLGNKDPKCTNYKVDAPTKNALGKLVYPYTLSKGANEVNVALELAKEANLFA